MRFFLFLFLLCFFYSCGPANNVQLPSQSQSASQRMTNTPPPSQSEPAGQRMTKEEFERKLANLYKILKSKWGYIVRQCIDTSASRRTAVFCSRQNAHEAHIDYCEKREALAIQYFGHNLPDRGGDRAPWDSEGCTWDFTNVFSERLK